MGGDGARDRLNEYASARTLTLAAITPLSQAQLDFSPRPGKWSIGEVADHLLLSEASYRGEIGRLVELARAGKPTYIRRSLTEANVAPLHLPNAMLSALETPFSIVTRLMPDSVRTLLIELPVVPTRNPDFATPRPRRPAAQLKSDLAASIAKTREVIAANDDLDYSQLISEHPLMGRTNVAQILAFLTHHERRHQGQMERVRMEPSWRALS